MVSRTLSHCPNDVSVILCPSIHFLFPFLSLILADFSSVSSPILCGNQIDPNNVVSIETLGTHVAVNRTKGTAAVYPVGFAIFHMHYIIVRVNWRKGTDETVNCSGLFHFLFLFLSLLYLSAFGCQGLDSESFVRFRSSSESIEPSKDLG
jgi:hypothetical protein